MSDDSSHSSDQTGSNAAVRTESRLKVDCKVRVKCPDWDTAQQTIVENLSRSGMFLPLKTPAPAESILEITLTLPDAREVVLLARICHVLTPEQASAQGKTAGIGVELLTVHENLMGMAEITRLCSEAGAMASSHEESATTAIGPDSSALPNFSSSPLAPVIGIDFGVTYSGVSVAVGDTVYMIPDENGRTLCPSVVSFPETGRPIAGWKAREALASAPQRTVASVKRILGYRYSDEQAAAYLHDAAYTTCAGPNDTILVQMGNDRYAVPQLCALILRHLCDEVGRRLKRRVAKAVFTYPVGFDRGQQEALMLAARLAGIEVAALIHEPVAAALAYGHGQEKNEIVAVYDFGGGTFDFTVLDLSGGHYRVLVSRGDNWLGGDDFDQALAEAVANSFWRRTNIELRHRLVEWQRLLLGCERSKRILSSKDEDVITVPGIVEGNQKLDIQQPLDRNAMQRLCNPLFERSLGVCKEALESIGLEPRDITEVVISGGTAHIPFIRTGLERYFDRQITPSVSMDEAVALGAGVFAARLVKHPTRQAKSF